MIRLLVASGVRFYREGLVRLLAGRPGIDVVGDAPDWVQLLAALSELDPRMVLLDVALAPAVVELRDVVDALGGTKVVVIALPSGPDDAIRWVEAGVNGYVPKDASVDELCAVIGAADRGEAFCSPAVAAGLFARVSRLSRMVNGQRLPAPAAPEQLTPRERQVARLMARGWSNKRIARQLGIRITTTKNHVHNVLQKLNLEGRGEVAAWHYEVGDKRRPD